MGAATSQISYTASKGGIEMFTKSAAVELGQYGIRVNCVAPAFVRTPMLDETAVQSSQEVVEKIEQIQLLGFGDPVDVANTIVFFLSDASKWVSATSLVLGGGLNVQMTSSGAPPAK